MVEEWTVLSLKEEEWRETVYMIMKEWKRNDWIWREREILNGLVWKSNNMKGGLRSYESNGKSTLYVDGWKNGLRKGYGTESRRVTLVYIGEWKWRIC